MLKRLKKIPFSWSSPRFSKAGNGAKAMMSLIDLFSGMITDLFLDAHKFRGVNVKSKVSDLMALLESGDFEAICKMFYDQRSS